MLMAIMASVVCILIFTYHRERVKEAEQAVRAEYESTIKAERRLHMRDILRLYDEIMELQAELAAADSKATQKAAESYRRGRDDKLAEITESDRFIKAYENQCVRMALAVKGGAK